MKKQKDKPALDLMEEAVHRLRMAPAAVLFPYYVGTLPFLLALLYFLVDMSLSPFADNHAFEFSGAIALLFLWMKCWQSVFAWRLRLHVAGHPFEPLTVRRLGRIFLIQTILQPLGLLVLPVSLVLTVPFGWMYALYQNSTVFGDGDRVDIAEVFKRSWSQAKVWPGQNHVLLAFLSLIGLVVLLDVTVVLLTLPQILQMLFGYENVFTFSGYAVLNTTFLGVVCCVCYLCLDPFVKALYVLRCFYGEAIQSGEDLKADLKRIVSSGKRIAIALLVALLLSGTGANLHAEQQINSKKLDDSISRVIRKPEFQWRLPREKTVKPSQSILEKYLQKMLDSTLNLLKEIGSWINRVIRWFRDLFPQPSSSNDEDSPAKSNLRLILILTGVILVILGIVLWRIIKRRKQRAEVVQAVPLAAVPDLAAEDVTADLLPEEGWQRMARELFERGELRLAVRAIYLGGLAFLADRDMLSIAKYKSNKDYLKELRRRAHERQALQEIFSENISVFERSWYGDHEVTEDLYRSFDNNSNRMRTLAQE